MKTDGIETIIEYVSLLSDSVVNLVFELENNFSYVCRHFLLADTKEEGLQWMSKLNKTLSLIRTWGPCRSSVYKA